MNQHIRLLIQFAACAFCDLNEFSERERRNAPYPSSYASFTDRSGECAGIVSSPNFPSNYGNGEEGFHFITVPAGNVSITDRRFKLIVSYEKSAKPAALGEVYIGGLKSISGSAAAEWCWR